MRIRKNARMLTPTERDNFLGAILAIKATPHSVYTSLSIYDYYVMLHKAATAVVRAGTASALNMAHFSDVFLPWHRELLLRVENELRTVNGGMYADVTIPYWDWSYPGAGDPLFADDYMGPVRGVTSANLASGYFAPTPPPTLPPFWPSGFPGFQVLGALDVVPGSLNVAVRRNVPGFTDSALQTAATNGVLLLDDALLASVYSTATGFRMLFEAGNGATNGPHAAFHFWFGSQSHMANPAVSPNDPMFWMHHANVDRIWALWQRDGHEGTTFYPATTSPAVFGLNDPMWPYGWAYNPGAAGAPAQTYTALGTAANPWPSSLPFINEGIGTTPDPSKFRTPANVIDHLALGYRYDTEVVLGMTVDRSGSMSGPIPVPATGTPLTVSTKWDAAKLAVSNTLQDCETAFTALEGSVIAGVTTFTTTAGVNNIAPVLGTAFGLVKSTGTYTSAAVQAALDALAPEAATPIAAALTSTEASIVRAAEASGAADDARYLAILTDGLETSPPLLNTLGTPEFPNTYVSAMGFGMGSGWNGVNYTAIDTIVSKGAVAPPGVPQAFHGDSLEELDKFFHNTLATALGYSPFADPTFELQSGEHTHVAMLATSFDLSFYIVCQGFDFDSSHWQVALIAPNGRRFERSERGSIRVEKRESRGRTTFFVKRIGATDAEWVGDWRVEVMYGPTGHHHGIMIMPELFERLLPTGAPPLAGPLYRRHLLPPAKRPLVRQLAPVVKARRATIPPPDHLHSHGAVMAPTPDDAISVDLTDVTIHDHVDALPPCAFSLNIYHKGSLRVYLEAPRKRPRAGRSYEVVLRIEGVNRGVLRDVSAVGRLVAPDFDPHDAFLDLDTIAKDARAKYATKVEGRAAFDDLAYLADYEVKRPDAFPIRSEVLRFRPREDGNLVATVPHNAYPGIHRIVARFEASLPLDDGRFEMVERTVELEILVVRPADGRFLQKAAKFVIDVRTGIAYNADLDLAKDIPPAYRAFAATHDELDRAGLTHFHADHKA